MAATGSSARTARCCRSGTPGASGTYFSKHVTDIDALVVTPNDGGYDIVGRNGAVYPFGNAVYHGSLGGTDSVGAAIDPATDGYWLATADGSVTGFDAPNYGSAHSAIVGIVAG
jgi:hypothetical protein